MWTVNIYSFKWKYTGFQKEDSKLMAVTLLILDGFFSLSDSLVNLQQRAY